MYPSTKTNVNSKDKENRKESLGTRVCSTDVYNCLDYTVKPDSYSEVFPGSSFWGEEFWVYRWLWEKKGVYQLHHAETWLTGHLDHAHGILLGVWRRISDLSGTNLQDHSSVCGKSICFAGKSLSPPMGVLVVAEWYSGSMNYFISFKNLSQIFSQSWNE